MTAHVTLRAEDDAVTAYAGDTVLAGPTPLHALPTLAVV